MSRLGHGDSWRLHLIIMCSSAALVGLIQSRAIIPKEPIKFDLDKLNPLPGLKRIFMSTTRSLNWPKAS